VGTAVFLASAFYVSPGAGLLLAVTALSAVALSSGLTGLATVWLWGLPVISPTELPNPGTVLRRDRAHALVFALITGLIFGSITGTALGLYCFLYLGPGKGIEVGLGVLLGGGALAASVALCFSAWAQFNIARGWLALRRQLPLNTMAFLENAKTRGVLRQSGGIYRFRHRLLQDRLANSPGP
jgi:hypothetical protein